MEAAPLIVAPLIVAPGGVAAPAGGGAEWFTAADGARLRVALFAPEGKAKGSVVISPGRTEPIEKYLELTGDLLARGFAVLVHDWRGQGLSQRVLPDRLAGHAVGFDPFVADYRAILTAYEARLPRPWLAVAHSMGGCLALAALAQGEDRFAAALLASPMLGVVMKHPLWLATALSGAYTRFGRGGVMIGRGEEDPLYERFGTNLLTHDRVRFERMTATLSACPDLALGGPTWGWLSSALAAMAWLRRPGVLAVVTIPVTILSAGEDLIVDNAAQAYAAARLPKGKLVTVPGAKHEILQETDDLRAVFWREFEALA